MSPDPAAMAAGKQAITYLTNLFGALIDERRRRPADDLVSALATASTSAGEEPMTPDELTGFCVLLLVAGLETTASLIATGAMRLAQHPDQRARLVADPRAIPNAIEEMVRYDSPIPGNARTLTRDVERHGEKLRAGEKVLLLYAAANRDDREFPDGDRFDVGRTIDRHVAFGPGIHFCLGASPARLEALVAFEELLRRFPDHDPATQCRWTEPGPTRSPVSLPIRLR